MTPGEASKELVKALETVPGLRVAMGMGLALVPPAAVIGPPVLEWEGLCTEGPTLARWSVYVVTNLTEFALDQLLDLVIPVTIALDEKTSAVVTSATPGVYPAGQQGDLPAYQIEVEMELGD